MAEEAISTEIMKAPVTFQPLPHLFILLAQLLIAATVLSGFNQPTLSPASHQTRPPVGRTVGRKSEQSRWAANHQYGLREMISTPWTLISSTIMYKTRQLGLVT